MVSQRKFSGSNLRSMEMKVIRTGLAALILAAGVATIAAADDSAPPASPGPVGESHGGHGPQHLYEKLGLSADQKARVDAVFAAKGPSVKSLHNRLHGNMETLHKMSPDDPNYATTVSQLAQSSGTLTTQLVSAEGDMRSQLFAILTSAQKTQLKAIEAKMSDHMKREGHGQGPRHWGPEPEPDAPAPPQ